MVPELLSSNLCSLLGKKERFAFSAVWEMTPNVSRLVWKLRTQADVVSTSFTKSIIKSKVVFGLSSSNPQAAMMYSEAQLRIDDKSDQSELTQVRRLCAHVNWAGLAQAE